MNIPTTAIGINRLYDLVRRDLEKVEKIIRKELKNEYAYLEGISRHLLKFAGKRLRPSLLLYFANMTGGVKRSHLILAATIEILHSATLVHDDILDEAEIRRNVTTINNEYGNEEGVIYGDLLFSKVFVLCARLQNQEVIDVLSETTKQICTGELLQLSQRSNLKITERDYLDIIKLKTATLFETACKLGCIENTDDPRIIEAARTYGMNVGIAFQIIDDCLDITGEENEIGKSLGTDVNKGKMTLPCLELFKTLDRKKAKELENIFLKPNGLNKRAIVRELISQNGVMNTCISKAKWHINKAIDSIAPCKESEYKTALTTIADYVVNRIS